VDSSPHPLNPPLSIFPLAFEGEEKEESKRGEASKYVIGSLKGTKSLFFYLPLPWEGRGIKGVGCKILKGVRLR